jgi:intraflagellar transport protein 81
VELTEKQKGIMGFSETRNKLEEISEKKGNIDEMKEKTLEEISKIVTNIENQLKQKKAKL